MKKRFFLLQYVVFFTLTLLLNKVSNSQISKGGVPFSFSNKEISDSVPIVTMPAVNVDSILEIEKKQTQEMKPFRFGHAIDVEL